MCSVVGCASWRRSAQRFKLPEDPEKRLEWVQFLATVNRQRFKESSWTDITICGEHFKDDCFENTSPNGFGATVKVHLKASAVPSECRQPETDEPRPEPQRPSGAEAVENTEVTFQYDQRKTSADGGSVPKGISCSADTDLLISAYSQMKPKNVNIDLIREKATLLKMKGKCIVNEKCLLQLFSSKCPLCGCKLQMEKVTYGVLLMLNQQCLQCDYRNQWKSQVTASVPPAEQAAPAGDTHSSVTGFPEIVAVVDEESELVDDTEETSDQGDTESDKETKPVKVVFPAVVVKQEIKEEREEDDEEEEGDEGEEDDEEEEDEGEEEYKDYPSYIPGYTRYSQLCAECGMFFGRRWPHTCEHKIRPYSCNICGKRCVSEVALNTHSRIHDEGYEHRCKYCQVTFKTKVDKITHEQIHVIEGKPYKCPDCSETFATNKERKIHLEVHTGPKQLKCHICGIEFLWPLSLQRHLAVHTGEKPFKCSECQRGFKQAGHLKSHMRLHTGERPFKCQHCDKCFNHNVSLKSHVQRYHTSGSGCERKKEKMSESTGDSGDAQENGNKAGADSELDNVDEEEDSEEEEITCSAKKKRRTTGRPIGRPKRFASDNLVLAIQVEGQDSNPASPELKRTQYGNKQRDNNMPFDSAQEEENTSRNMTKNAARPRGRPRNTHSDSDFNPEDSKKRHSSRNSGKITEKRRGRPRKKATVVNVKIEELVLNNCETETY